jgi:hypothetical protein
MEDLGLVSSEQTPLDILQSRHPIIKLVGGGHYHRLLMTIALGNVINIIAYFIARFCMVDQPWRMDDDPLGVFNIERYIFTTCFVAETCMMYYAYRPWPKLALSLRIFGVNVFACCVALFANLLAMGDANGQRQGSQPVPGGMGGIVWALTLIHAIYIFRTCGLYPPPPTMPPKAEPASPAPSSPGA